MSSRALLLCLLLSGAAFAAEDNLPAAGFDQSGSDPRAIAIADVSMQAMGGRKAWDDTRYLTWCFFGKRLHVWDKWTGDVRIEYDEQGKHTVILMNINTGQGRAFQSPPGAVPAEVTEPGLLATLLKDGKEAWINDSYWLVMPYKLKDSGVTLRYKEEARLPDGRPADVLLLTFVGVGVTPENKYDVYVARDTHLVEQWAYYERAGDPRPRFVSPWQKWKRYGTILLSADRGGGKAHTGVNAPSNLPASVFTSPAPVSPAILAAGAPG